MTEIVTQAEHLRSVLAVGIRDLGLPRVMRELAEAVAKVDAEGRERPVGPTAVYPVIRAEAIAEIVAKFRNHQTLADWGEKGNHWTAEAVADFIEREFSGADLA